MSSLTTSVLPVTAAVCTAAVGGVFFAFSAVVMPALGRLATPSAVAAMQSVNVTAVRAPLMIALFGTAALTLVAAWRAVASWGPASPWLLAGAAAYLLGTIAVTIGVHVPMNDHLATLDPASAQAAADWGTSLARWTSWNHVRAVSGVVAAAAFLVARGR